MLLMVASLLLLSMAGMVHCVCVVMVVLRHCGCIYMTVLVGVCPCK